MLPDPISLTGINVARFGGVGVGVHLGFCWVGLTTTGGGGIIGGGIGGGKGFGVGTLCNVQ